MDVKEMMIVGLALFLVGVIVLALMLAADSLGIGEGAGLGPNQILGIVAGALLAVAGLVLAFKKRA